MKWFFLDLGKEYNKQTNVLGLLFKFIYQQGWAAKQGHWYLKLLKLLGRNLQSFKTIFLSWQNLELNKGDTIYALFEWTVLTAVKVKINEIVSKVHYEPNKIFWYFNKI